MRIVMIGINHRTAPIELREKLSLGSEKVQAALVELKRRYALSESVLLSTCNRTELYVARPTHEPPTAEMLREFLAACGGVTGADLTAASIHREQEQALYHLFRVSSGLDSMVLGEPQILGQVKRAYEMAAECSAVGPILHRIFQQAIATAKKCRSTTGIDAGRVSIGSVAADFARQIFSDFSDKTVLGVGAGEIAKVALRHLLGLAPKHVWLVNRSPERALALAETLSLVHPMSGARSWEQLDQLLVDADIVVSSTAAREPILTVAQFRPILKQRRNRPLFIIDIAVPRDVEPQIGSLTNVYLYNIDDLQSVVSTSYGQRQEQVKRCEAMIAEAVEACMAQVHNRDIGQLIHQLRMQLHDIGQAEQERTNRKLEAANGSADKEAMSALLAEHTHRVINKILHLPLSQLDQRKSEVPLAFYAAALRRLFKLEDPLLPPIDSDPPTETDEHGQGRTPDAGS
jgi:glutamyl-tRNA reductase